MHTRKSEPPGWFVAILLGGLVVATASAVYRRRRPKYRFSIEPGTEGRFSC